MTQRARSTRSSGCSTPSARSIAEDVRKLRADLQRTVFEDQTRKQVKRTTVTLDRVRVCGPGAR
jgi:hypothetical protein